MLTNYPQLSGCLGAASVDGLGSEWAATSLGTSQLGRRPSRGNFNFRPELYQETFKIITLSQVKHWTELKSLPSKMSEMMLLCFKGFFLKALLGEVAGIQIDLEYNYLKFIFVWKLPLGLLYP
jgi:hypothetical protein